MSSFAYIVDSKSPFTVTDKLPLVDDKFISLACKNKEHFILKFSGLDNQEYRWIADTLFTRYVFSWICMLDFLNSAMSSGVRKENIFVHPNPQFDFLINESHLINSSKCIYCWQGVGGRAKSHINVVFELNCVINTVETVTRAHINEIWIEFPYKSISSLPRAHFQLESNSTIDDKKSVDRGYSDSVDNPINREQNFSYESNFTNDNRNKSNHTSIRSDNAVISQFDLNVLNRMSRKIQEVEEREIVTQNHSKKLVALIKGAAIFLFIASLMDVADAIKECVDFDGEENDFVFALFFAFFKGVTSCTLLFLVVKEFYMYPDHSRSGGSGGNSQKVIKLDDENV